MLTVVDADGMTPNGSLIDEIVREGARRMLAAALEAEVNGYLAEVSGQRDEAGRRLVVRNGFHAERMISTSAGPVQVKAPRVNDRRVDEATGERKRFSSAILPPWARKTPKISEVLPLLYLHGLSTGDFVPALEQFLGSAVGLSSATVSRLTAQWSEDHKAFQGRDLSKTDFVYVWADGVHLRVRLDEAKACVLVMVGVRADGSKELIALDAGYRESGESWSSLLRDAARRGMRAPVLAVGDGALGFWKALREVFPGTREQRCWVHKTANVLDALPKSAQPAAKNALADIYNAEDKEHAGAAVRVFAKQYAAKFPKAVAKVVDDQDVLLAFYDYPAEHWIHLRTTNPIESTFATVRLRTKVTRGAGSRAAALAMTFKLIESAQQRWRAVNAPHLVALVRAGGPIRQGRAGGTRTGHRGMTDHAESPLLFLDVDGPLLPFGDGPQPGPSGDASTSHLSRLDPHVGHRLAALPCQLVWATTWEEEANAEIGPRIGLPRLPVVLWPEPSDEHERADQWFGLHWKTRTVVAWADGRPFAWIDDETTDADRDWVAAHHPSRALLHHVMSSRGLTDDDFAVLDQWLRAAWVNHRI